MSSPKLHDAEWFFVCEGCNAKFFYAENHVDCPRCGEALTSNEQIQTMCKPRLMTIKEVSRRLSISQSKLYGMVERSVISHTRIGGAIRFSEADLSELLEQSRKTKSKRGEAQPRESKPPRPKLRHVKL